MAVKYLSSIDLNKTELQNAKVHVLASAPSNPQEGQIYYNSTDNKLFFYDGSAFVDASGDIKSVGTSTSTTLQITVFDKCLLGPTKTLPPMHPPI